MMTVDEVLKEFSRLEVPDDSGRKRLQECIDLAEKKNIFSLMEKLRYLNGYAGEQSKGCRLYHDFAPFSLGFVVIKADGKEWFNGGLIYYGKDDLGYGAPQFSVRGSRTNKGNEGWEINT